jgi:hypothetical protein
MALVGSPAERIPALIRLGDIALYLGEFSEAQRYGNAAPALLPVLERVLGDEHPDTLNARSNLAYWTRQAQNSR